MNAERLHAPPWNGSAHLPRTCVSGMEWKGMEGNGRENYIIHRHLRNARAVDNSRYIVARRAVPGGDAT